MATVRVRVVTIVLLMLAAWFLVVAITPARRFLLNDQCHPEGFVASVKARAQGARFWRAQLSNLDSEVESWPRAKAMVAEMRPRLDSVFQGGDSILQDIYSRFPQMRPSAEQQVARQLRDAADSIEHAGTMRLVDSIMAAHAGALLTCRPLVEGLAR